MKILFLICFITSFHAIEPSKCERSASQARDDLQENKIQFMLQGGIVPIRFAGQKEFEQKYQLKYFDLGCVAPVNLCLAHYNAEVAKYLDKKYGKAWRKEVKKDVLQPIS